MRREDPDPAQGAAPTTAASALAASPFPWALRRRGAPGPRRGVVTSRWRRPWLAHGPWLRSVNYAGLARAAE